MIHLLKKTPFEKKVEFKLEYNNKLFIVGTQNCKFVRKNQGIAGNLFLDEILLINKTIWTPSLFNPLNSQGKIINKRINQLYLPKMIIASSTWKKNKDLYIELFLENIQEKIIKQYKRKKELEELNFFFGDIYYHYINYF